jgi:hypothetical protein
LVWLARLIVDPLRTKRNVLIVAVTVGLSVAAFLVTAASTAPPPGTSRGGPNVLPQGPITPR